MISLLLLLSAGYKDEDFILSPSFLKELDSIPKLWKSSSYPDHYMGRLTYGKAKSWLGAIADPVPLPDDAPEYSLGDLPENFDSRLNWPACTFIADIEDQSNCGSCWAVSAASAMGDRLCIKKGENIKLGSLDLLACCGITCGMGCNGGYPGMAWKYFTGSGVVTEKCFRYPFPKCYHGNSSHPDSCAKLPSYKTPACPKQCNTTDLKIPTEKRFGKSSYSLSGEKKIMQDIYENGPIVGTFTVYEDFTAYKSGIYHHVSGKSLGGHAVRVIGWGQENGVKYWLISNSWNVHWGERGLFRILRGKNECGIENGGSAGLPK
jgi:C1A family cysteine protease